MRIFKLTWPAALSVLIVGAIFHPTRASAVTDAAVDQSIEIDRSSLSSSVAVLPKKLPDPVLAVEILRALKFWTHQPEDVLLTWANAIADACSSRQQCIQVASIAAVESKFEPWVLDYSCNSAAWRKQQRGWERGSCDGGWAVGPWQIHNRRLLNASPEDHARDAVVWFRNRPQAWTPWLVARKQADQWLAASQ
jgi:hypothetical protein